MFNTVRITAKRNGVNERKSLSMARRRYQRGQLIREGSVWLGRWREDVVLADGEVKRVRRKEVIGTTEDYPTKRLAERELEKRLAPINNIGYRPTPTNTFAEFAEKWQEKVMVQHKPSTQRSERSHLKTVLVPTFGKLRLRDINPEMVQEWVSESTAAPKTTRNHVVTLRSVWATAKAWNYVSHDPFAGLKLPELIQASVYHFSLEETLAIIDKAKGKWKTFFRILAETGMRPGELAGLRVIDVGSHSLRVAQSVWQQQVQTTKTKKSVRTFAISEGLGREIKDMIDGFEADNNPLDGSSGGMVLRGTLLFQTETQTPLGMDNFRNRVLNPILDELGIRAKLEGRRCGNYAFRHMNATLMDTLNVPMATRQSRLGHAPGSRMTMGTYTHAIDTEDRRIADALGALMSGAGKEAVQ